MSLVQVRDSKLNKLQASHVCSFFNGRKMTEYNITTKQASKKNKQNRCEETGKTVGASSIPYSKQ